MIRNKRRKVANIGKQIEYIVTKKYYSSRRVDKAVEVCNNQDKANVFRKEIKTNELEEGFYFCLPFEISNI